MAYGTKYRIQFSDLKGVDHKVLIQEDGYSSSVKDLEAESPPVRISWKGDRDKFEPIIASECEINLLVTENDSAFLGRDFVAADDTKFKVIVQSKPSETWIDYWKGFIVAERYREEYTFRPYSIKLRAIDGIGLMEDRLWEADQQVGSTQKEDYNSVLDIIKGTLAKLTPVSEVVDLLDFYEDGMDAGHSPLSQTWVDANSLFKEHDENKPGELKRKYARDVLEDLLKPFGARIYLFNFDDALRWYIERVNAVYHNRGNFNFADTATSSNFSVSANPSGLGGVLASAIYKEDKTFNTPGDLVLIETAKERIDNNKTPEDGLIFTNESSAGVEFIPAYEDAAVKFEKKYTNGLFDDVYSDKELAGLVPDPFFAQGPSGDYWGLNGSVTVNLQTLHRHDYGGAVISRYSSGTDDFVYSKNKSSSGIGDGSGLFVNGQDLVFQGSVKAPLDTKTVRNNVGGGNSIFDIVVPQPQFSVRLDVNSTTYWATVNSNNELELQNVAGPVKLNFSDLNPNEKKEAEYVIKTPNLKDFARVQVYLWAGQPTKVIQNNAVNKFIDTIFIWRYAQISNDKDQNTTVRSFDGVAGINTTQGRYEKDIAYADAGFHVANGLKYFNNVTSSPDLGDFAATSSWAPGQFGSESLPLTKALTRMYARNLRTPSMILDAELWHGNLKDNPFRVRLEEDFTGGTKTKTLLGSELEIDLEQRRVKGQWIENLKETENLTFIDSQDSVFVPDIGIPSEGPVRTPSTPIDFSPQVGGTGVSREITSDGESLTFGDLVVSVDLCSISGEPSKLYLPEADNVNAGTIIEVVIRCDGCSGQNIQIFTSQNDNADFDNSTTAPTFNCNETAKFRMGANGNWTIL